MKSGRALTRAGDKAVISDYNKGSNNQIFVFDSNTGSIQPRRDNKVSMDIGEDGRNRYVKFSQTKDMWHQHFHQEGDYIVNERGLVFDVEEGKDANGTNVHVWKKTGQLHQQWKIQYV